MASIIRRHRDLLGVRYFCPGPNNRVIASAREARKLVSLDISNSAEPHGSISVPDEPGAIVYADGFVYVLCEDGWLRKYSLTVPDEGCGDIWALAGEWDIGCTNHRWLNFIGANLICTWVEGYIQIVTTDGVRVVSRATTLEKVEYAALNVSRLYVLDGRGHGETLNVAATNIVRGERFDAQGTTTVDAMGMVDSTTLGVGANGNPRYITFDTTDPDAPVFIDRDRITGEVTGVLDSGPIVDTETSPVVDGLGLRKLDNGLIAPDWEETPPPGDTSYILTRLSDHIATRAADRIVWR